MKTTTSTNQNLRILLLITIAAMMAACAPKSQTADTSDLASRSMTTVGTPSTGTKPIAVCNKATGTDFSAGLKAATNTSGQYVFNQVYVKVTNISAAFANNTQYLNMWRWMANAKSATYLDPTPLNFYLYDMTNAQAVTGWKNSVKWSDVSTVASGMGISDPVTFFARVIMIVDLRDTDGAYDAIKFATYDTSTNTAVQQTDALLPLFWANPADYAYDTDGSARPTVLQDLHPLKDQLTSGWSSAEYMSMTNGLCPF